MKQRQFITIFSLIMALTGLSQETLAVAGDSPAGVRQHTVPEAPTRNILTTEQMDNITAGTWNNVYAMRQYYRFVSERAHCNSTSPCSPSHVDLLDYAIQYWWGVGHEEIIVIDD
jgi:hypothetical protein